MLGRAADRVNTEPGAIATGCEQTFELGILDDVSGTFESPRRVTQEPTVPVNGPTKRMLYFRANLNCNP